MVSAATDDSGDDAIDEAIALCQDPSAHRGELIQWLTAHPELAGELAEALGDMALIDQWMAPFRVDSVAANPSDSQSPTIDHPSGEQSRPADSASLQFGDFELLGELGRGGMGVVHKARQKALNKIVALKTTLAGGFQSGRDVARLQFEAESAARLEHPNIVPIYGAGVYQGMPFFSMRFVSGGTLAERMKEYARDLPRGAGLLAKIARGVHYAHQRGVVHRDLKPGNILIENGEPMIADFGLAKTMDLPSGLSVSGAIVGTPAYMAPEQARGGRGLTTSADVYSLGAILYEMLTGRPPFRAGSQLETIRLVIEQSPLAPSELGKDLPRDLEAVCLKCLEKNAGNRYATAAELADDLERFRRGEAVLAKPRGVLSRFHLAVKGRRTDVGSAKENWTKITFWLLLAGTLCHLGMFALIRSGATVGAVWALLMTYFSGYLIHRLRQTVRSRMFSTWERHLVNLMLGHLICSFFVALCLLPFKMDDPAATVIVLYPIWAILFALVSFVRASISTGVNYVGSLIYLMLAVGLRFTGDLAPVVFLLVHIPVTLFTVRSDQRSTLNQAGNAEMTEATS